MDLGIVDLEFVGYLVPTGTSSESHGKIWCDLLELPVQPTGTSGAHRKFRSSQPEVMMCVGWAPSRLSELPFFITIDLDWFQSGSSSVLGSVVLICYVILH